MGPDRVRCNAVIQNSMAEHGLNQKCLRTFLQRESFVVHAVISRALDDCAFQLPPCQGEVQFQHGLAWLEPTAAGHPQEFRRSAGVTSRMSSLGFGRSTHTTQGISRGAFRQGPMLPAAAGPDSNTRMYGHLQTAANASCPWSWSGLALENAELELERLGEAHVDLLLAALAAL